MDDDSITRPTIETVLERINALDQKLEVRLEKVDSEVSQLRQDVNGGFRKVERKIEVLYETLMTMRADHKDLLHRVEDLESRAT